MVNPLPEIAGLRYDLPQLIDLSSDFVTGPQRVAWKDLLQALPPFPMKEENGRKILVVAHEILGPPKNVENPELYAIFPYRLYEVGKPDIETGRLTFEKHTYKVTGVWRQDAIQAALQWLSGLAQEDVAKNFPEHAGSRFPAFSWTGQHDFDWIPGQDHGGVAMIALESMLTQTEGKKILLFPAWPKECNVKFKLRAPLKTTIEGVYRDGRVEELKATSSWRRKDAAECRPN